MKERDLLSEKLESMEITIDIKICFVSKIELVVCRQKMKI